MKSWRWLLGLLLVIALGYGVWRATAPDAPPGGEGGHGEGGGRGGGRALSVRLAPVEVSPMPVFIEAVGTVEPSESVTVRAQTTGVIRRILFEEGSEVKAGQPLFDLDVAPARAQLAQVRAQLSAEQARLAEARATAERLKPLADKEYVTRQEYGEALAAVSTAQAAAAAARAQVEAAQVEAAYGLIRAPISGRTGDLRVKAHNLVAANGTEPLVVINQLTPVLVRFSIPAEQLPRLRARAGGEPLAVRLTEADAAETGRLVFVDNAVSAETGTVLLKARFENRDKTLWPGEFKALRVILEVEPEALHVPEAAVQPGQESSYVWMVEDGKAAIRPVKVDRVVDGRAVIRAGLRPGERIIVEYPQDIREGARVKTGGGTAKNGNRPGAASVVKPAR